MSRTFLWVKMILQANGRQIAKQRLTAITDMFTCETIPNEKMKNPCRSHTKELNGHWLEISTCKDIGIQTTAIKMSLTAKFVTNMFGTVRRRVVLSTVTQIKTLPPKARMIRVMRTADSNTFIGMLR